MVVEYLTACFWKTHSAMPEPEKVPVIAVGRDARRREVRKCVE